MGTGCKNKLNISRACTHCQGDSPVGGIGTIPFDHLDAVDDGADAGAERTAGAVLGHTGKMGLGVKGDRLVAAVVAGHVALAAVDAHLLVDERHHLFSVVQVAVGADAVQCLAYDFLLWGYQSRRKKT